MYSLFPSYAKKTQDYSHPEVIDTLMIPTIHRVSFYKIKKHIMTFDSTAEKTNRQVVYTFNSHFTVIESDLIRFISSKYKA